MFEIEYIRTTASGGGTKTIKIAAKSADEATAKAKIRYEDFLVAKSVKQIF